MVLLCVWMQCNEVMLGPGANIFLGPLPWKKCSQKPGEENKYTTSAQTPVNTPTTYNISAVNNMRP